MPDSQLLDRVRQIVADVLNVGLESVNAESTPQTLPGWDSVQHLNLVLAMEQEFSVAFDPDDFERMTSVAAVAEVVAEKS